MDISNLALYGLVFVLQFLDWLTTKVFTSYNPLAEGNPIWHKKFAKNGGPTLSFLFQKLIVAGLTVYVLFQFQDQPVMYDVFFGIGIWLLLYVVIHNTCGIMKDQMAIRMGIYEPYTQKDLLGKSISSIFRDSCLVFFLFILGIVIYEMTQRTFILWMAAGILMLIGMSTYSAIKLYRSR